MIQKALLQINMPAVWRKYKGIKKHNTVLERVRLVDLHVRSFGLYDTKGIVSIICYVFPGCIRPGPTRCCNVVYLHT